MKRWTNPILLVALAAGLAVSSNTGVAMAEPLLPQTQAGSDCFTTDTTAATICGPIKDYFLTTMGGQDGALGNPTSGVVPNTGPFSQFGSVRADFENGVLYADGSTMHVGLWTAHGASSPDAATTNFAAPADAVLQPNIRTACPANTSAYTDSQAPFNCVTNFEDPDGYQVGVRQGTTVKGVNAANGQKYSPFGRDKYWQKHKVEDDWVELTIQDAPAVAQPDRDPDDAPGTAYMQLKEFVQGEDFMVDGNLVTGIQVGEYRGPVAASPDGYDMGVLTAYCVDASGNIVTECPAELPSPFVRDYPYGVSPTPPFS